jgi:UPF0716 protein FxsA
MRLLLLAFILVPIIEMLVLIKVGGIIGAVPTIGLVCLTAFVGVSLIRAQGISTLRRAQWRANHGELPGQEIVDGMCLAIGGAMLLTPGFVTDTFGFLLLVPGLRRNLLSAMLPRFAVVGGSTFGSQRDGPAEPGTNTQQGTAPEQGGSTIEGEFSRDK